VPGVAFTDTVGVMLAGSRQEVSHILCDMVRLEGSAPSASIVGQSLRASPQLAALRQRGGRRMPWITT